MNSVKRGLSKILPIVDLLSVPFAFAAAHLLRLIRRVGLQRLPRCRAILIHVGVLPVLDHYYEPLFNASRLAAPLSDDRDLPGIDWDVDGQLALLAQFDFNDELEGIESTKRDDLSFHFGNGAFESGDAEFLYNLIRLKRPKRIYEIGSGNSTLMARRAVIRNAQIDPHYRCEHVCIEPYEMPWLERAGVTVLRKTVESMDPAFFDVLEAGDLLFIDSSHVIRPQGDVLFEFLRVLPRLRKGVIVHVHDIFSPRDYLEPWIKEEIKLWNEQYLLEAFLSCNTDWHIIGALNFLMHHHYSSLARIAPYLTPDREPGSFYIERHSVDR